MQVKNLYKSFVRLLITDKIKQEILQEKQKSLKPVFESQYKHLTREERLSLELKMDELLYSLHFIFNSKHLVYNRHNPYELIEIDKTDDLITITVPKPYIYRKEIPKDAS